MPEHRSFPERFQVAFSFAGAQRGMIREVAEQVERLLGRGSVFFDEWFEYAIAGDDADLRLQDVYHNRSDIVVVCVSGDYNDRPWTHLEHRAIRALTMASDRLGKNALRCLPIRVGDGNVDGIYSNASVPDVRSRSPESVAQLIVARLMHTKSTSSASTTRLGSGPEIANDRPVDELIRDLCSTDPSLAMPAAHALAKRPDEVPRILDRAGRSMEPVPLAAVHVALRGNSEAAASLASRVIEETWHPARQAAHDLDTSHEPHCGARLGAAFDHADRDGQRILCYALGRLGAHQWAWDLLDRVRSTSEPGKLIAFALDGLAHMFHHSRADAVRRVSDVLVDAVVFDETAGLGGLSPHSMRYTLGHIVGDHVDAIVQKWVVSPSSTVRELGVNALGDARIQRAVPVLEELLSGADERIRRAASKALATIDTPQATEALLRSGPSTEGVCMCLHQIEDENDFRRRVRTTLSERGFFRWACIRAVGLRGYADMTRNLRGFLDSPNELERGCALLALARLKDPESCARVEAGLHEASGIAFEKVMAILAFVTVHPDRYAEVDASLRANLASQSYSFWYPAQRDIIDVLSALKSPQALHVVGSWRPFYAGLAKQRTG